MATATKLMEKCYVCLAPAGGSNTELSAYTKDIEVNGGKIPFETDNFNIGQVTKIGRQEAYEVDFSDVRVLGQTFSEFHESQTSGDLESGNAFRNGSVAKRLVLLWSNQPGITSAAQAITGSYWGRRVIFKDGFVSEAPESWTNFELKGSFQFFVTAYGETGGSNMKIQKCNINTSGQSMSALSAFTGGNFG